jgi:hypothetical protein
MTFNGATEVTGVLSFLDVLPFVIGTSPVPITSGDDALVWPVHLVLFERDEILVHGISTIGTDHLLHYSLQGKLMTHQ